MQRLPNCYTLSNLWTKSYYYKMKPHWPLQRLACDRDENSLYLHEKIDIALARTAYVLDRTVFNDYSIASKPIVPGGRVQAVPGSMLNWVAARFDRLLIDGNKNASARAGVTGNGIREIVITLGDFHFEYGLPTGVGLSGQMIHEARHLGFPGYGHVQCRYGLPPIPENFIGPVSEDDTNCDETISEEFENGGSHGIGILWLTWIATRSNWSQWDRDNCKNVVRILLKARINASYAVKNAFFQRYFGESL